MIVRLLLFACLATGLYFFLKPATPRQVAVMYKVKAGNLETAGAVFDYAGLKLRQSEAAFHKASKEAKKLKATAEHGLAEAKAVKDKAVGVVKKESK